MLGPIEILAAIEPLGAWSRHFDPTFNENLSETISNKFALQNSLVPDDLCVFHLREVERLGAALEAITKS